MYKKVSFRHVVDVVKPLTKPILKKQTSSFNEMLFHWVECVGKNFASYTQPLNFNAKTKTLTLAVEPVYALELQHCLPQLCEKINAFFGHQDCQHIHLKQMPIKKMAENTSKPLHLIGLKPMPELKNLSQVKDETLRKTLEQFIKTAHASGRCE